MSNMSWFLLVLFLNGAWFMVDVSGSKKGIELSLSQESDKLTFVILGQVRGSPSDFEEHLCKQAQDLGWFCPKVYVAHRDFQQIGAWTIFPILYSIFEVGRESEWFFMCDDGTRIHLRKLVEVLVKYDSSKDWFLGKALRDNEPSIIHHFAFHNDPSIFPYPDLAAGFVLTFSLLDKLVRRKDEFVDHLEFSIDASHEFAMFVRDDGKGVDLVDTREFCIEDMVWCATYYTLPRIPSCEKPVALSDIMFAVKSCKTLEDRISVILHTWGGDERLDLKVFTDSSNNSYPRVDLGIANTLTGHCVKTLGIVKYAARYLASEGKSWLVIADDDTLMSVPRLLKFLSCFDPKTAWAIGERYGFHTASGTGYDYITGGGGMVFSKQTVDRLVEAGACVCPSDDAPDDMILGRCLKRQKIAITHAPYFHQARPMDYSADRLQHEEPITFHKFWMMDPLKVYKEWLQDDWSQTDDRDEL